MNQTAIFWPMVAHVLLVYIVYGVISVRRRGAIRSGAVKASAFKTRSAEPESSVTAANNLINQFELPVLFHVLGLALFVTNGVSYLTVTLMWLFVLSRYVHALIHTGSNNLRQRNLVFTFGVVLLGIGWIWFALHLAGAA